MLTLRIRELCQLGFSSSNNIAFTFSLINPRIRTFAILLLECSGRLVGVTHLVPFKKPKQRTSIVYIHSRVHCGVVRVVNKRNCAPAAQHQLKITDEKSP